jgi:hypothetical protein
MSQRLKWVLLAVVLAGLFALPTQAKSTAFYRHGRLPSYAGILIKNGTMYAAFASSDPQEPSAVALFGKLLKVAPGGKSECINTSQVEFGIFWTTKACATIKQAGKGTYRINIVLRYSYRDFDPKDKVDLRIYKDYDFVRERRYNILFSIAGSSCSAVMEKRTYIPLDGKAQVPSTVGDLGCTIETS